MNHDARLDGDWWWKTGNRYPGILATSADRATLHLSATFPDFQSFEPGGRGANSKRNLIRGTTADGRHFTLIDCARVSSITEGGVKRSSYRASAYIVGKHFATYPDLQFQRMSFTCDYLNELLGETFVFPQSWKHNRGFRLSYRRPANLVARFPPFRIELSQNIPFRLASPFAAEEQAWVTIKSRTQQPFERLWTGPIATMRSLLSFMAERPLGLHHVAAVSGRTPCELRGIGLGAKPQPLRTHGAHEFLFTLRTLPASGPTWNEILTRWVSLRNQFAPVMSLYTAATNEPALHLELRFLTLAQALETFHKTKTGVEMSLRKRLESLYATVPVPLVDHIVDPHLLVDRIVKTRNYFTHYDATLASQRLRGFQLIETAQTLRIVLQYLLLKELGFHTDQAGTIAHQSFIRELEESSVVRVSTNDAAP